MIEIKTIKCKGENMLSFKILCTESIYYKEVIVEAKDKYEAIDRCRSAAQEGELVITDNEFMLTRIQRIVKK